jgi:flagellar hook-associated protein 2
MSSSTALTGLSGYDFSGIVSAMVQAYKLPETQMQTQQSTLQSQQSAWQDINTRLSALNNTIATLKTAATWSATSASSSNTSYVTVTGGSGAMAGSYSVTVNQTAAAEIVDSISTNDSAFATAMPAYSSTTGNWNFTINNKTVVVAKSSATGTAPTLQDICNSINSAQAGVTASLVQVDSTNSRITITANQTGQSNAISFTDGIGGSLTKLGIMSAGVVNPTFTGTNPNSGGIYQQAQDASLTLNGVSVTSASNTVTTAIKGETLNLVAAGNSTVTVAADPTVAQNAVQAFVNQYNSVQSLISSDLSYNTTTKTAGVLFGDAQLENIQSRLRGMMGNIFLNPTSPDITLSSVGITTSSSNFGEDPSLTFNTAKFTQAFTNNPQSVANLFSASYNGITPTDGTGGTAIQGLGNTLAAYLNPLIMSGGSLSKIYSNFTNQISDIQNRIGDFDQRATVYEDMLNAKFSHLETVLSQLNSQGSWLTNQINSMTGSSSTSSSTTK